MDIEKKIKSKDEINKKTIKELKCLFDKAYFNSHMYIGFLEDLKEKHKYFQIFLAFHNKNIVGVVVLEDKLYKNFIYGEYIPAHIKRFTINPKYRNKGIGKLLLDKLKYYAFNVYGLPAIFGESNEIGGIAFYLREGALFNRKSIETYLKRNSKEENLYFFKEFINNKSFRTFRYPVGQGLFFVFAKDKNNKQKFFESGFYDINYFLSN